MIKVSSSPSSTTEAQTVLHVKKGTEHGEKAKRIYRAATDSVKRHDVIIKGKKPYRSAFTSECIGLRNRLKEYCERLMFMDPLIYGQKAEEVLWQKVFYSIIAMAKTHKHHILSHSSIYSSFRTHLSSAIGFYHHLLLRLQMHFSINIEGYVDFHFISDNRNAKAEISEAEKVWAKKSCYQCLIYLGDVARYREMFSKDGGQLLAERYYFQALSMFPNIGTPYNQLGVLYSSSYYGFNSAYYYIRCVLSEVSFEGSRHNLQRLFDKNTKNLEELPSKEKKENFEDQRCLHIHQLFSRLLNLLNFFFNLNKTVSSIDIQEACQSTLQDFSLCMFYPQSALSIDSKPHFLTPDIVFKIAVCSMAAVQLQQKSGQVHVTAAIALLLALASHIINHTASRLQMAVESKQQSTNLPTVDIAFDDEKEDSLVEVTPPTVVSPQNAAASSVVQPRKQGRKQALLQRRRRKRVVNSDSDLSDDLSSEDSDLSEGCENLSVSSLSDDDFIDCLDRGSDSDPGETATNPDKRAPTLNMEDLHKIWSCESNAENLAAFSSELFTFASSTALFPSVKQNHTLLDQNAADPAHDNADDGYEADIEKNILNFIIEPDNDPSAPEAALGSDDESESSSEHNSEFKSNKELEVTLEILQNEHLLPVVKILCDWLRSHINIVKTCAQSTQSLWIRLAVLLNMIPNEDVISSSSKLNISQDHREYLKQAGDASWVQCYPVKEDVNLQCFPPLSSVHHQIHFDIHTRASMTEDSELALRLVTLRQFGYFVSNMPELEFSYNADDQIFSGPIKADNSVEESIGHVMTQEQMRASEAGKNRLMRDMAQLRLQKEVDELQGQLDCTEVTSFPPFIVIDSQSLCEQLTLVRQLTQTSHCILIVPLSVIDTLDMKKKDSQGARNAIRWLETEFKKGNRFVRDQKATEHLSSNPRKALKKKNRQAWEIIMTLDCAMYLSQQSGQLSLTNMVTLLVSTDTKNLAITSEVGKAISAAGSKGVNIEHIKTFCEKWKDARKLR